MPLRIAHITASPNFGGVERLMLDVGTVLQRSKDIEHLFASFTESGNAAPFLHEAAKAGFPSYRFHNDMPHLAAATFELIRLLRSHQSRILCAHGHKARMLGWFAARHLHIPILGISHGWTGEDLKIKVFDRLDQWMHRRMDHVVCVSQGQADKVIRYGTPPSRISVIYNAVRMKRFAEPSDNSFRHQLESLFPSPPALIIGAAGRFSPEKGFDILITAINQLVKSGLDAGLVLFGEGGLREPLQKQIKAFDLGSNVALPGFTDQLDQFMSHFDLFVQSSHTEGLPSVLLESMAARTAVVATEVGGTGELIPDESSGILIRPNDPHALAEAMRKVLNDSGLRRKLGEQGRQRVEKHFSLEMQAEKYWELYRQLSGW